VTLDGKPPKALTGRPKNNQICVEGLERGDRLKAIGRSCRRQWMKVWGAVELGLYVRDRSNVRFTGDSFVLPIRRARTFQRFP
jgi:hypothetical protein